MDKTLLKSLQRPLIMGILNVTPDSFYDGGKYITTTTNVDTASCVSTAIKMLDDGADIIDIGGESTRPGAIPVDVKTEITRVIPVIKTLKEQRPDCVISVDTYHPETATQAIKAGAEIWNSSIWCAMTTMNGDEDIAATDLSLTPNPFSQTPNPFSQTPNPLSLTPNPFSLIIMHSKDTPQTMQDNPQYDDVIEEISEFFREKIENCVCNGIPREYLILDPGIGFGKTFRHNITILKNIDQFKVFGLPILLGASRKSFISEIYPSTPDERLVGSLATTVIACMKQVDIVRVHDVKEHREMIKSLEWML